MLVLQRAELRVGIKEQFQQSFPTSEIASVQFALNIICPSSLSPWNICSSSTTQCDLYTRMCVSNTSQLPCWNKQKLCSFVIFL